MNARTFTDSRAARAAVPLLIGMVGPSGSGKTYSSLRLATGMQRVTGGEVFGIDTEANRMLHYAPKKGQPANPDKGTFAFTHVPFSAPFGPLDYLAAIEHCVKRKAKVIVIDSMSHEHEGPGGVLEQHAKVVEAKGQAHSMLAWAKPKSERRRLLNTIIQLPCSFIFCFRAKEKIKPVRNGEPVNLGWMAIAGEEFVYEMTANALLLPGALGVPTWQGEMQGERETIKLPSQFAALRNERGPIDEAMGERFARWAAGDNGQPANDEPPMGALKEDRE